MLVSVIIPTYNYEKYIGETLQSLIAQSHQDWECLVVDNGSTDNTREFIAEYVKREPRIRYFHKENERPATARNLGLRMARGKYIQFLDADDLLESKKLRRHVEFLESHPDVELVYGEFRYFRDGFPHERLHSMAPPDTPWLIKPSGKGDELIKEFIKTNFLTINAPLVRKSALDRVGEFDTSLDYEDWEYWFKCAAVGVSMQYLEAEGTYALVRVHSRSRTHDIHREGHKESLLRQKFSLILRDNELRKMNERLWVGSELVKGLQEAKQGVVIKGFLRMLQAVKFSPSAALRLAVERIRRNSVENGANS